MKKIESIDNNKHMPRFEDFEEKVEDVEHESADTFDITHKNAFEHSQVVNDLLKDLDLQRKPKLLVLNKIDLLTEDIHQYSFGDSDIYKDNNAIPISAYRRWGFDNLVESITRIIEREELSLVNV